MKLPKVTFRTSKPNTGQAAGRQPRTRNRAPGSSRSVITQPGQNRTFSYAANRLQSDFNTGREATQHRPPLRQLPGKIQKLRRHFGWLLAAVACIGITGYELQLSTTPKVVSVIQSADAPFLQDNNVYVNKASELFNTTAANRNKLTVNTTDISRQLEKQFPELQDVSITLPLIGDRPIVYIRPATAALLLSSSNGVYVIDENGRAVAVQAAGASGATNTAQIPMVTDQSGIQAKIGIQVLPRSATAFTRAVVDQLKAQQIKVKSMILPAAASELDVYIEGTQYYVKFNMHDTDSGAAALQAGAYVATSKQLAKQRITPAQYIDVRLEGRAYYK